MNFKQIFAICVTLFTGIAAYAQPALSWAKQVATGLYVTAITTDDSGNLYSTGIITGTVDVDPGPGVDTLTDAGFGDIFITKMTPDGTLQWAKRYGNSSYDQGSAIVTDASGNVYVTGFFSGDVDFGTGTPLTATENTFVLKLDPSGSILWVKQLSSLPENSSYTMALAQNGDLVITGRFEGSADFDPGPGSDSLSSSATDIYIWRLDNNGNHLWAKQISSTTSGTSVFSGTLDHAGNILITGILLGTTDFDPGPGVYNLTKPSTVLTSGFILKLDGTGNFIWAHQLDNCDINMSHDLAIDSANNYYLAGYFNNTVDFDFGTGVQNLTSAPTNNHFLLKIASNAAFDWVQQLPGIRSIAVDNNANIYTCGSSIRKFNTGGTQLWASDSSLSVQIAVDPLNNIYTAGTFSGTVDFDPGPGVYALTGDNSVFYQKFTQGSLGVPGAKIDATQSFSIYPNPNNGIFTITAGGDMELFITNISGQVVYTTQVKHDIPIQLKPDLPGGSYIVSNKSGGGKMIIISK